MMRQPFEIAGTTLTIHLPAEIDHHNAEGIPLRGGPDSAKRKPIRRMVFDFETHRFYGQLRSRDDPGDATRPCALWEEPSPQSGSMKECARILTLSGVYKVIDIYEDMPRQF